MRGLTLTKPWRLARRSLESPIGLLSTSSILHSRPTLSIPRRVLPPALKPSAFSSSCSAPLPSASSGLAPYEISGKTYQRDKQSNTPPSILAKIPRKLLHIPSHPLAILRQIIESHFASYTALTPSSPVVTIHENFDELGFAPDHPSRALTDSYYLNSEYMLRCHTSAHEVGTYRQGLDAWLLSADVYRRDEIDASHYPVFHQMEGTHVFSPDELHTLPERNAKLAEELSRCPLIIEDTTTISDSNPYQVQHDPVHAAQIAQHLKHSLNSLIFRLFGSAAVDGEPLRIRWIEAFFPFTTPSYEVEVWWQGEWLEILGSGVVMQKTLEQAGVPHKSGWAFGLGLERIAMVLFGIPDIRLFWSEDPRFLSQFTPGEITTFQSYSKYPACYKDLSFWLPAGGQDGGGKTFHENDYCEIIRDVAGDLVESVTLVDEFTHPKSGRRSRCYRSTFRSMDRSLTNEEIDEMVEVVKDRVVKEMDLEIR